MRRRSAVAWIRATALAAVLGLMVSTPFAKANTPPAATWLDVTISALPFWLAYIVLVSTVGGLLQLGLLALARRHSVPRPLADIVSGAAIGLVVMLGFFGSLLVGQNISVGLSPGFLAWVATPSSLAGAALGVGYWLLAGRPKPPYVDRTVETFS